MLLFYIIKLDFGMHSWRRPSIERNLKAPKLVPLILYFKSSSMFNNTVTVSALVIWARGLNWLVPVPCMMPFLFKGLRCTFSPDRNFLKEVIAFPSLGNLSVFAIIIAISACVIFLFGPKVPSS